MQTLKHVFLITLLTLSLPSLAHSNNPFRVVQDWFAATSAFDEKGVRSAATKDFHLLENGHIWDMDKLASGIVQGKGRFKRRNFFSVIQQQTQGDMMWISYWNKAIFSAKNKETGEHQEKAVFWAESIVLVKVKDLWKIQMLHSTKVEEKTLPKDVPFEEYVGK